KLSTGRNEWFWTAPQSAAADDYFEGEPHPDGSVYYTRLRGVSGNQEIEDEDNDVSHAARGHITLSPVVPHGCHEGALKRLKSLFAAG
ncbi:MAG: hypothetical protein LBS31_03515, partial [Candidatus Adiutrix sp.]|nr:hypothetical protein [Candidatus Adiutrix sp.]